MSPILGDFLINVILVPLSDLFVLVVKVFMALSLFCLKLTKVVRSYVEENEI